MKVKWIINFVIITISVMATFLALADRDSAVAAGVSSKKIEGLLLDQIASDGSADFIVRFAKQADLSAAYSMDWETRGEFVFNTLHEAAERNQVNAKSVLDVQGFIYQTFIAGNELYVWSGNQATTNGVNSSNELKVLSDLAALPEVDTIRATRFYSIDPVEDVKAFGDINWEGDLLTKNALTTVQSSITATKDWGITDTKSDQFWTTFGVQGNDIVVANIDTGVQWDHPALDQAFKCGNNPSDPTCWSDPANICGGSACDNNGHGTHTMGTMVGDDDPALAYIVGMAPNAKWIACKGCESNTCSDFALSACADWILAPGGSATNRPNIVNNSWGGETGGNNWFLAKVQAWRAAGIFPAFSVGNSGSGCNTLISPGDNQESFGSAAHDSSRSIAYFSSRGPSPFGHDPYTKPNISAPGVSICSSIPTNSWSCGYSGTSMASPHTAGAVALLWSCNRALIGQIDSTFQVLQNNTDAAPAGTCGAPADGQGNYTYGYGYLNVLSAGFAACSGPRGTLTGHVYDAAGAPITGARISAVPSTTGNQVEAISDSNGFFTTPLLVGTYNITSSKIGYAPQTINGVIIIENLTTVQDFRLSLLRQWTTGPTLCFDLTRFDGEFYPGTGKVYFLGGRSGTSTIGHIYSFDPITGECSNTGAEMPTPISNYTVSLVNDGANNLLCSFGGRNSVGGQTMDVQCYNPLTNTASAIATLPIAWTGYNPGAQVVVNNAVYIFGGFNGGVSTPYMIARTEKFDPVTKIFTQLGDLNLGRAYIMATSVKGIIYAFGGDTYVGGTLHAQTIAEKMDPALGIWDNMGVADLPLAGDEGQAFGFESDTSYNLENKIALVTLAQYPGASNKVILYDVGSNTYKMEFANLINARRNHAGVYISLDTQFPTDGLPGMWVFGGYLTSDYPPYSPSEYYSVFHVIDTYLPLGFKRK